MGTPQIFLPHCIAAVPYFDLCACAGPSMATVTSGWVAPVRVLVHYFFAFGPWQWFIGRRTYMFSRFEEALSFLQGHEDFPSDANHAEYLILLNHEAAYLPIGPPPGPPPGPPAAPPPPAADFW